MHPSSQTEDSIPAAAGTGLAGRALIGWMDREQAVKFLMEDCLFSTPLTFRCAEKIWESRRTIVENLREPPFIPRKLPLTAADLKAARRFRSWHPGAESVVDFVRLNPMDLVVHQLWVSTAIAGSYRDKVMPEKWLLTALLDPPSNPRLKWRREDDTIVFDVPHFEYFLAGPLQPDAQLRVSEADSFVTVALHADRALLLRGYHRTFACAQRILEAPNAPHGVLFGVSNHLALMGSDADDVRRTMEGPRPPRMGDFCDDRLFLPVTLRRRRYQLRIHYHVTEIGEEENTEPQNLPAHAVQNGLNGHDHRGAVALHEEALRYYKAGRADEALALYERALFLKPDYADAHINLAVALAAQGRLDEAVEHYERALVIDSNHAEAHNDLGNILQAQGKFDDALTHYGRAIAIRPAYPEAHLNRAEIKSFHPGDADLTALEALAGKDDSPVSKSPAIHFALAKALDDCGDCGRAFEHLRKGNALKRAHINYDEQGFIKLFERTSRVFDRSLFDRLDGGGDPSPVPIFVLGMPRSGSSLIEQILASHPLIHGAGELEDLEKLANTASNAGGRPVPYPEYVPDLDGAAVRRMAQAYLARLPAPPDGKVRIVDKLPINFVHIGLIRLILPNARIVHTVRDPIDTCVSCYSRLFTFGQEFTYDLAELGRYYRRYRDLMAHWQSVLPPGAMLDVSYEEVVDDLEGQARRLIDYCGLPWDDRCLSFHQTVRPVRTASAAQVRKPLFRGSLQRWRKYQAGLGPLLQELDMKAHAAR
jgi:tetratricopeptide (TPR) repeat protein